MDHTSAQNACHCFEVITSELENKVKLNETSDFAQRIQTLRENLSLLPSLARKSAVDFKKIAFRLWNVAVEATHRKLDIGEMNPRLRHIACDLLALVVSTDENDYESSLTSAKFFARTGKMWAECGNSILAENCWNTSLEICNKLKTTTYPKTFPLENERLILSSTLFSLYVWRAEAAWQRSQAELAYSFISKALDEMCEPTQILYLSVVTYNFGVQLHSEKKFQDAVKWLELSVDIYNKDSQHDKARQAKTLRLLANCYIEQNNYEKALRCIELANMENLHPAGFYLLVKVSFLAKKPNAPELLYSLLNLTDCPFDMAIAAVKLAAEHQWENAAVQGYRLLAKRFDNTEQFNEIRFLEFELQLQILNNIDAAVSILEEVTSEHHTGKQVLNSAVQRQYHCLMWNRAIQHYKNEEYHRAIEWFKRCLQLLGPDDASNQAQCFRLIGRCHFLMGDLDKALESAQQSLSIEHNSSITQFLLFEIYLQQNKEREVLETLNKLVQCNDKNIQALLEICAQKAFEHGKKLTAIKALEGLLNLFKPDQPGHLAVIIRTLIKLSMQHFEKEDEGHELQQRVASYVKVALDKLKEFGVEQLFNNTSEEIKWFLDTCWNFGLETAKNEEFDLCYDFFSAFITLSKCLPQAIDTLQIQQYAMLLSISAKLSSEMKSRNKERLLDLLQQVDECKQISKIVSIQQQQQKSLQMEVDNNNNNIPTKQDESSTRHETELSCAAILLVLEFAIHAFLGENSTGLQRIAENSKNINDATFNPAIYEIMADFALQASATNVDVAISSLQKCFEIYANRQNYEQCGRLLRKLINRCRERERAYYYFERALSLLKNVHNMTYSLPTIEIKWLTTTAYNYGVYYWRLNRFVTAEKWMSLSISLMNYLVPQEKSSFESEIMSSYSAVLKKLSKDKVAQSGDNMEL